MSFGQLQSIRYAILNFLQDIKVLVSIFVSRDQQYPDGSFKYFPPDRFYKGIGIDTACNQKVVQH